MKFTAPVLPATIFIFGLSVGACSRESDTRPLVPVAKELSAVAPISKVAPVADYTKWNLSSTIPWADGIATCVSFSDDGRTIAVGGGTERESASAYDGMEQSGVVRLFNIDNGESVIEVLEPEDKIRSLCFFAEGERFVLGHRRKTKIIDAKTGSPRFTIQEGTSMRIAFNHESKVFSTMPNTFWDAKTGRRLDVPSVVNGSYAAFSPDGSMYCVDGTLYELASGRKYENAFSLPKPTPAFSLWAFSHDSKWIASAFAVWSVSDPRPIWYRSGRDSGYSTGVLFSPDDRAVFASDGNGSIGVFSSANGDPLATIRAGAPVNDIALSPNGLTLVSVGGDVGAPIKIWKAATK
jgi:WD40 repeat protein